ncbi:acyltransferase [Maribellus maritimus]|uniref:acyltransferase n=1 Tax=Maribellus maritimus TaxID=2870838 RepID=UPI001EEC3239|nr:acyltransferase [Maribellus maritimus]MCG6191227.1 acyltransferase [Maribellus maritimus]
MKKVFYYFLKKILPPLTYAKFIGVKVGHGCIFYTKIFGNEPYLIEIGDNVQIAGNVSFWTHGGGWIMRDTHPNFDLFGKIKIGSNVYIGSGSSILPGVTVGNNVIVAARSVVTKSVPDGVIVGGNPAKIIGLVSDFKARMLPYNLNCKNLSRFSKEEYLKKQPDNMFVQKDFMENPFKS